MVITRTWFYIFLGIHLLAWTLAPLLLRFNLPLDSIEGTIWGHQLEWGYDKDPIMNAWLTALLIKLGLSSWGTYFFCQLSIVSAFWAVWKLGSRMFSPLYGLLAVLLMEAIQYNNFHAIDFNDNTLEVGFWALTILFFYQALHKPQWRNWLLTGLFAGFCMLVKYYSALLLLSMGLYLLSEPKYLKKPAVYASLAVFMIIITPHLCWLFSHQLVTVNYALERIASYPHWSNHFYFPLKFTWEQLEVFLPALILGFIFLRKSSAEESLSSDNKKFLLFIGLGPFLLTIVLSLILGIKLRAGWGQPLLILWPLILIAYLRPHLEAKQFYTFFIATVLLLSLLIVSYARALIKSPEISSADYPGTFIAKELTLAWQQKYHTPLKFVAGQRWVAGNIAFYSKDKPSVYIDCNHKLSPWIHENKLSQMGAIFVWNLSDNTNKITYEEVKQRFPQISALNTVSFAYHRNSKLPPIVLGVAFLRPA